MIVCDVGESSLNILTRHQIQPFKKQMRRFVYEKQTFMSSSILATCVWMLPTISLSGDIVGYLPSSHTNLHAQPKQAFELHVEQNIHPIGGLGSIAA
jgi:hypothetical protein